MPGSPAPLPNFPSPRLWRMRCAQVAVATGRVQAVRMVEPLLWRPFGWCRLEIDVAGSPGRDHSDGSGRMRKTLLPVGHADTAWQLMRLVTGPVQRCLSLATVHLDAAGRNVHAQFRERPGDEARPLVEELAALCRSARQRVPESGIVR